jgi:hypothetical protein
MAKSLVDGPINQDSGRSARGADAFSPVASPLSRRTLYCTGGSSTPREPGGLTLEIGIRQINKHGVAKVRSSVEIELGTYPLAPRLTPLCGGRVGGRHGSGSNWSGPPRRRCRTGQRSTGRRRAMAWFRCGSGDGGWRISGGESGRGRWIRDRWT